MAVEVAVGKDVKRARCRVCRRQWSVGVKWVGEVVVARLGVVLLVGMVAVLVFVVFSGVEIVQGGHVVRVHDNSSCLTKYEVAADVDSDGQVFGKVWGVGGRSVV